MIYTDGTIAINAGSPIVTGTGTQWKKNIHGVAPGQLISIENGTAPVSMMIRAVNSDTELVLSFNAPVTLSGAKYSIATTVPDTISDAARTMSANQGYIIYFLQAMQQWMTDTGQVEIELPNGQKVTLEDVKGLASREWVNTILFGVGDKTAKASGIMNPDNTMWWCKYPGKKTHSLSEIFIHTDMYSEEIAMRKARFTEHQIIAVLKSVEAGRTVKDVCREAGISEASYYNWKAKYGGMEASDIKKLKDLEEENRRLKQMFADLSLECRALKDVIEKKL